MLRSLWFIFPIAFCGAIYLSSSSPTAADDTAEANRLFVASVQAWEQAEALRGKTIAETHQRLMFLEAAADNLEKIVNTHAGADLAVQLMIGNEIGPLSIEGVRDAEDRARLELVKTYASCIEPASCASELALHIARSVADPSERADALIMVAVSRLDYALLLDASKLHAHPRTVPSALRLFAIAQLEAGLLDAALATSQEIDDEGLRNGTLSRITEAQTDAGQFEAALDTVQHLRTVSSQYQAITYVAVGLAKAERFQEAFEAVQDLGTWRDTAYVQLFALQAAAGDSSTALENIRFIRSDGHRISALTEIAGAAKDKGLMADAVMSASGLEDVRDRAKALERVVAEQAKAEMFVEAVDTANRIENIFWREKALGEISANLAKAGSIAEALETAHQISDRYNLDIALGEIAAAQAGLGLFAQAAETAQMISDTGWEKTDALVSIVGAQARAELFSDALMTSKQMSLPFFGIKALAVNQAKKGLFADALTTILEMDDPRGRVSVLVEIANLPS